MPVHEDTSDVTRFGHVDAIGDAESLIAFLDTASALVGLRAAKQVLLDQLRLGHARSVLDVGCGTGADLIAIAERLPQDGGATGIDVSESMTAEARRRASGLDLNISFDSGAAANLPYDDASFGACRAATVLQHVPDADQVIREMIRVTRPGGRVAALEFDQDSTMLDHPDRDTTRVMVRTSPMQWRRLGRAAVAAAVPPGGPDGPVSQPGRESRRGHDVPGYGSQPRRPALRGQRPDRRPGGDWWQALERQTADGHFLAGAVIFVVAATRPDGRTG